MQQIRDGNEIETVFDHRGNCDICISDLGMQKQGECSIFSVQNPEMRADKHLSSLLHAINALGNSSFNQF